MMRAVFLCLATAAGATTLDEAKPRVNSKMSRRGLQRDHVNRMLDRLNARTNDKATTHFYEEALVDHFDGSVGSAPRYWRQRYYVDDSQYGGAGSPIFVYIGGEGPQGPPSPSLFMYSQAQEHEALMVSVEHRYYGESRPVPNMTVENLAYLTSAQALADLARFITYFRATYAGADSGPLVTFGGSYPGALSSWFKLKYPALAVGSIASSAPVFAVFDFYQYAQVVGAALKNPAIGGSATCSRLVSDGASALAEIVESTTPFGTSTEIPDALRPCAPMTAKDDLAFYYSEIYSAIEGTVQYNLEGHAPDVSDVCAAALGSGDDALTALAAVTTLLTGGGGGNDDDCVASDLAADYAQGLSETSFSADDCDLGCASDRQWIWQSCNEFGYFQTTSSPNVTTPFSAFAANDAASAGLAVCREAFGLADYAGPRPAGDAQGGLAANAEYGARHYSAANVTFVNGNMDPWHSLGIVNATDAFYEAGGETQVTSPQVSVVELNNTAHCRDMTAPNALQAAGINDTASVQWAHARIAADIARYLS